MLRLLGLSRLGSIARSPSFVLALAFGCLWGFEPFVAAVSAQTPAVANLDALRARVEQRYTVLPLQEGLALTPRSPGSVRTIEIRRGVIAIDGVEVAGAELRQRLGADADLVLELSYLDATALSTLSGAQTAAPPAVAQPAPAVPQAPPPAPTLRRRGALVRFGGDVTVPADEIVTDDVVAIGGDATVDGQVEGELVVIGGNARLGPRAAVRRDVTVVGGALTRDPGATIGGEVNEVSVGGAWGSDRWGPRLGRRGGFFGSGWPFERFTPSLRLGGTLVRLALLVMLASVAVVLARTPVERIAERAAAEPLKSGLVGFVAELAIVPVLLITVVGLAFSIVGIPLLLFVPVALMALAIVFLMGFSGVSQWLGRQLQAGLGWSRNQPVLATLLGIALLVLPLLLGRFVGLIAGFGAVATILVAAGALVEYVAWTVGLGAAALVRFGPPLPVAPGVSPDAGVPPVKIDDSPPLA
jgi:hypothetical protein